MARNRIQTFFLAALLALGSAQARALDVPAGKAAVLEAVIGKVEVTIAGKTSQAKVGQVLAFGDVLNTGSNGRVSLRHAGNAISRLAPNTDLTLLAPTKSKGVFLSLTQGLIRFLVGQRAPGEVFEVSTRSAVAAVKGTDAEVETDGHQTRSSVFSSEHKRALSFMDRGTGKDIDLAPGQSAVLRDDGFKLHDLDSADLRDSDRLFKGLPAPVVDAAPDDSKKDDKRLDDKKREDEKKRELEKKEQSKKDDAGKPAVDKTVLAGLVVTKTLTTKDTSTQDGSVVDTVSVDKTVIDRTLINLEINDAIKDAISDVSKDLSLDKTLESDDRGGDLAAGRVAVDRNGDRTQISNYVQRTDAATIVKSTYSQRDTGPYKGVTSAEESVTWNRKLPDDWASVANRKLDDKANLDKTGLPIYYLSTQSFVAKNPLGDSLVVDRTYQQPYYVAVGSPGKAVRGALLPQGYSQSLHLDGQASVLSFQYYADSSKYAVGNGDAAQIADAPTISKSTGWSEGIRHGKNGDALLNYDDVNGKAVLYTDVTVLTGEGKLVDANKLVPTAQYLRDFRGLDNSLNIELTFSSAYMKAPIDLMVIPAFFDSMDFFDVPLTNG